jgi:predicted DNA-binding protein YlxM (UPF0122 family)
MARSKDTIQDRIRIATFFSIYGPLLSERQRRFIDLHYNEDLSLSEIAEGEGISRQAVFDAIKQGKKRLARFESVLHMGERALAGQEPTAGAAEMAAGTAGAGTATAAPGDASKIRECLEELDQMARSGVIYDTRRVKEVTQEIRGSLGEK